MENYNYTIGWKDGGHLVVKNKTDDPVIELLMILMMFLGIVFSISALRFVNVFDTIARLAMGAFLTIFFFKCLNKEIDREAENGRGAKMASDKGLMVLKALSIIVLIVIGKTLFMLGFLSDTISGTVVGLSLGSFLVIFSLRSFQKISKRKYKRD